MDISGLTDIFSNDCHITNLFAVISNNKTIVRKTVRSKGQYTTQRFYYIMGGKVKFVLNNKNVIECGKGDILYLPPDATYTSYWEESEENSAIHIVFDLLVNGKSALLSDEMFIISNDRHEDHLKRFLLLANTYTKGFFGYKIKCQAILLDIIYSFLPDLTGDKNTKKFPAVSKGILYIENNYMNDIDVNEIAALCTLSPSAFRSQFKALTGMSPIKYKNYLKMKKAAELLKTGELTVCETARELGFDDIYYFNRLFKSYFNTPPGKYKAE